MNSITLDRGKLSGLYGSPLHESSLDIFKDYLYNHKGMMKDFDTAFSAGTAPLYKCVHFYAAVFTYVGFPQLTFDCNEFCKLCAGTNNQDIINSGFKNLLGKINDTAALLQHEMETFNDTRNCG
jgi:hypothetical protein